MSGGGEAPLGKTDSWVVSLICVKHKSVRPAADRIVYLK